MKVLLVIGSFAGMEGVSYALHRWVMHRIGMRWHGSHHRPARARWEANDIFPALFSVIGIAMFALATMGPRIDALWWCGIGVTAYGVAYLVVHEIYIHRRLSLSVPPLSYFDRVRDSHRIHHLFGGEPYGMLFPVVPRDLRARAAARAAETDRDTDARPSVPEADVLDRSDSTRSTRSRL
ncbi:MAG: sterol desaturase family protein [Ilumatobacteraceae bacterium]